MSKSRVLIESVTSAVPSKGTNAGRTMYVINGNLWSRNEPDREHTHVITEKVTKGSGANKKTYTNVVGFTNDTRMPIKDKIKTVTSEDAAYSMAIATLLR